MIDFNLISKFIRFGLVGLSGMGVDFGITWILREKVKLNQYISNTIGFICAVVSNFTLNKYWTFGEKSDFLLREFLSFAVISLLGLGINTAILFVLVKKVKCPFYVSKLFATAVVMIWNFSANYLLTFNH